MLIIEVDISKLVKLNVVAKVFQIIMETGLEAAGQVVGANQPHWVRDYHAPPPHLGSLFYPMKATHIVEEKQEGGGEWFSEMVREINKYIISVFELM